MYATDLYSDLVIWSYKWYIQCFVVVVGSRIKFVELCRIVRYNVFILTCCTKRIVIGVRE